MRNISIIQTIFLVLFSTLLFIDFSLFKKKIRQMMKHFLAKFRKKGS